jgi:hypothetical protein
LTDPRETLVRVTGLVVSAAAAALLAWLLATQPPTMADLRGGLTAGVGLYRIDRAAFDEGLRYFRDDRFREARLAFSRADPAGRDATSPTPSTDRAGDASTTTTHSSVTR